MAECLSLVRQGKQEQLSLSQLNYAFNLGEWKNLTGTVYDYLIHFSVIQYNIHTWTIDINPLLLLLKYLIWNFY